MFGDHNIIAKGMHGKGRRERGGGWSEGGKDIMGYHSVYGACVIRVLTALASTSSWSKTPPGIPHLCCHH